MKNMAPLTAEVLLEHFPIIDPPITLSSEVAHKFSSENKPLSQGIIAEVFSNWEELDEFSEIVPCFRLNTGEGQIAIIYWKGGLMTSEYVLVTLNKRMELIDRKIIAGTISNGNSIKSSVANVDTDFMIYTVVGEGSDDNNYDPTKSQAFSFEIMSDGHISSSREEQ